MHLFRFDKTVVQFPIPCWQQKNGSYSLCLLVVRPSLPFGKALLPREIYSVFHRVTLKGRKGLTTVYLGETRRKPISELRESGVRPARGADRQLGARLNQQPPRSTRYDPDDAPLGLVCADVE